MKYIESINHNASDDQFSKWPQSRYYNQNLMIKKQNL